MTKFLDIMKQNEKANFVAANAEELMQNIEDKQKQIGQRIKNEREKLTFTNDSGKVVKYDQERFGKDLLHTSRQTISSWERGKSLPSLRDFLALCSVFDCDIAYLLCEQDCKTKVSTDINAATGLSEEAVKVLIETYNSCRSRLFIYNELITHGDDLIDSLDAFVGEKRFNIKLIGDVNRKDDLLYQYAKVAFEYMFIESTVVDTKDFSFDIFKENLDHVISRKLKSERVELEDEDYRRLLRQAYFMLRGSEKSHRLRCIEKFEKFIDNMADSLYP